MNRSPSYLVIGVLMATAATIGCGSSAKHGYSSSSSTWSAAAEKPIAGIDEGSAAVSSLISGGGKGVTVVVWCDSSRGMSSSGQAGPQMAFVELSIETPHGRQVPFRAETTDGELATVVVEDAEFTTAVGNLFLISIQNEKPRVAQINVTVDDFPQGPDQIRDFAAKHEEITRFFQAAHAESTTTPTADSAREASN